MPIRTATADYDNGLLKLIVEDTGTGMTEDEQQRGSVALLVWDESNLKCRPFVFLYTNNLALITKT